MLQVFSWLFLLFQQIRHACLLGPAGSFAYIQKFVDWRTRKFAYLEAAETIAAKSGAFKDAPPIKPPST